MAGVTSAFQDKDSSRRASWAGEGRLVLIVGHRATWLSLELLTKGEAPETILAQDDGWRPGWDYTIRG